jgi:hypothetical protein
MERPDMDRTDDEGSAAGPRAGEQAALRRLLAAGDHEADEHEASEIERLAPVTVLPTWADAVITAAAAPALAGPASVAMTPREQDSPAGMATGERSARILPFRRPIASGVALAVAAAAVFFVVTRPTTPDVPVDSGALIAPAAVIRPPPLGGQAFTGSAETHWSALELGYRFEAVADWESSTSPSARFAAVDLRQDLTSFATRWARRRGLDPQAFTASGDRTHRLEAARVVLDEQTLHGFDLGRWLYLVARHRAGAGPPPPAPARNAAALAAWVEVGRDEGLRAALDGFADDPAGRAGAVLGALIGIDAAALDRSAEGVP